MKAQPVRLPPKPAAGSWKRNGAVALFALVVITLLYWYSVEASSLRSSTAATPLAPISPAAESTPVEQPIQPPPLPSVPPPTEETPAPVTAAPETQPPQTPAPETPAPETPAPETVVPTTTEAPTTQPPPEPPATNAGGSAECPAGGALPSGFHAEPANGVVNGVACSASTQDACAQLSNRPSYIYLQELLWHVFASFSAERPKLFVSLGAGVGKLALAMAGRDVPTLAVEANEANSRSLHLSRCLAKHSPELLRIAGDAAAPTESPSAMNGTILHIGGQFSDHIATVAAYIAHGAAGSARPPMIVIEHRNLVNDMFAMGEALFPHGYIAYSYLPRTYATSVAELRFFGATADFESLPSGSAQAILFLDPGLASVLLSAPHQPYELPLAPTQLTSCHNPAFPAVTAGGYKLNPRWRIACTMNADAVCQSLRRHGQWEPHIFHAVDDAAKFLRSSGRTPLFLDVGANVGTFALRMAGEGHETYAFEMLPTNVQMLHTSMCLNGFTNFSIHQVALDEARRGCKMISGGQDDNDGILDCTFRSDEEMQPYVSLGDVTTRTLDEIWDETLLPQRLAVGAIPVVKLDIEGAEYRVLRSATKLLSHPNRPMFIIAEVWKTMDLGLLWQTMRPHGYVAFGFYKNAWLFTEGDFDSFAEGMQGSLDTIAFMSREYAPHFHKTGGQYIKNITPFPTDAPKAV